MAKMLPLAPVRIRRFDPSGCSFVALRPSRCPQRCSASATGGEGDLGDGDRGGSDDGDRRNRVDRLLDPGAELHDILGLSPASFYSTSQLKSAFRARVKEFHPDVYKDKRIGELLLKQVINAYEVLSAKSADMFDGRDHQDPFEEPECEASDLFVNEMQCVGTGCQYSCVKRAPEIFSFSNESGAARVISQGHGDEYLVQLAVGQCPRRCIHYVTPLQRAILQDLLSSALQVPYDPAEEALLDTLILKAKLENNRYRAPTRQPTRSEKYVDWM